MKKIFTICAVLCASLSVLASEQADTITLDLSKPTTPSAFTFGSNKAWTGTYGDTCTWIECGPFLISHAPNGTYSGSFWNGFTVSKSSDTNDYGVAGSSNGWVANQWGNIAGGGIKTDANGRVVKTAKGTVTVDAQAPYLLGFWSYWGTGEQSNQIKFKDDKPYQVIGVYVTNSPWPFYGCIHGDGFARAFDEGDTLKIIAHGVAADATEETVELPLISYSDGYLHAIRNWKYWDLSALGTVKSVYFTMTSTDTGDYGANTALYFCMDKFMVKSAAASGIPAIDSKAHGIAYDRASQAIVLHGDNFAIIYDAQGKKLIASEGTRIDISALNPGMYVVKTASATKKIIK